MRGILWLSEVIAMTRGGFANYRIISGSLWKPIATDRRILAVQATAPPLAWIPTRLLPRSIYAKTNHLCM